MSICTQSPLQGGVVTFIRPQRSVCAGSLSTTGAGSHFLTLAHALNETRSVCLRRTTMGAQV